MEVHPKGPARPGLLALAIRLAFGAGALLLLTGFLWNLTVAAWQHWRNPVPAGFYRVDGRVMHLYCTGAGPQTVVIEAGGGADWLGWQGVQERLSSLTRLCTYDRAGHGWSEPRPGVRDAEAIVRELHALLDAAAVPRPLVLTGHSLGGLYVREYAREFPSEVAAVILIESSSPVGLEFTILSLSPGSRQTVAWRLMSDLRCLAHEGPPAHTCAYRKSPQASKSIPE